MKYLWSSAGGSRGFVCIANLLIVLETTFVCFQPSDTSVQAKLTIDTTTLMSTTHAAQTESFMCCAGSNHCTFWQIILLLFKKRLRHNAPEMKLVLAATHHALSAQLAQFVGGVLLWICHSLLRVVHKRTNNHHSTGFRYDHLNRFSLLQYSTVRSNTARTCFLSLGAVSFVILFHLGISPPSLSPPSPPLLKWFYISHGRQRVACEHPSLLMTRPGRTIS